MPPVKTMETNSKAWMAASDLVSRSKAAVMTTANSIGQPHAAWMNVLVDSSMETVVAISAPTTQKIKNLQENPSAEWMFASPSMESVAYLTGPTEILTGELAQNYWNCMPGKSKAPYKNYSTSDDHNDFAIICTKVDNVVYCRPPVYHKTAASK